MSKVSDRIISWWWFTWPTQRLYNFSYFYLNLAHRVAKEKFLRQQLVYNCQLLSLLPRPWPLVSWDVKFMPSPPGLIFPCGLYAFRITWLDTKPMSKRSLCPINFFSRGCKIIHLVVLYEIYWKSDVSRKKHLFRAFNLLFRIATREEMKWSMKTP